MPISVVRIGVELYARSSRGNDGRLHGAARASRDGHVGAGGVAKDVAFLAADDEPHGNMAAVERLREGSRVTIEPTG